MNNKAPKISLWRTEPIINPLESDSQPFLLKYVFPSGRQALSCSLSHAGLGRPDRVAFPEWSSHCVVSAIGRFSTPIPISEVLEYQVKVAAVLVYEQWGWPLTKKVLQQLKDYFKDTVLILDMVDSAHFNFNGDFSLEGTKALIRITSLSKLLGLTGGGLALFNGNYLHFEPDSESERVLSVFEDNNLLQQNPFGFSRDIFKHNVAAIDSSLKKWLEKNDLLKAIENERILRQENLKAMLNSPLTDTWPKWMKETVEDGAGPGMAPLLKDYPEDILVRVKESLINLRGVETCIYHFNWSGDPLKPAYEKCLAFPVHGMVRDIEEILESIEV